MDLDEDELREEIAREEAGAGTEPGAGEDDDAVSLEEGEEKLDRVKELATARDEMLAQIEYVWPWLSMHSY